jgi:4,5-DOPA dioxygenase extradiol
MLNASNVMPVLFVGHGSPMNAVEVNDYTKNWVKVAQLLPKPKAILAISAHWYTAGTRITDAANPKTVYDMYGFPEELYKIEYKAPGAPDMAHITKGLIHKEVIIDNSWGYDHGTWSVLHQMYPEADIPVYQMSVDRNADAETHYRIGMELKALREKGVLIFGSGNVVHNLQKLNWDMAGGYPWAEEFDQYIKEKIVQKEHEDVVHYEKAGTSSQSAFPTPEHFYPLLYVLGAVEGNDHLTILNEDCMMGSLSMTSYLFQQ